MKQPQAGGSYTRDPETGELTKTTKAVKPKSTKKKGA